MKRRGKIARLPREIRQELNERLHEEEIGKSLAEWLNGLPEVQAVLKAQFEGAPITEQNISEWRKRGYAEWVQHEDALEVAVRLGERAQEWKREKQPPMSEAVAFWLMSQLLVATREVGQMEWEKRWPQVNKMCAHLMKLRRIEKEAKKERQEQEASRPKRKAMAITEEEVEEWREAMEEEKAEMARREAQAAEAKKAVPTAKMAQPGKMGQAEKVEKAVQDVQAAQVARAVQSAKTAQMAKVVRAALVAKAARGAGAAPAIAAAPTDAVVLADAAGRDAMFSARKSLEKGSAECLGRGGFKGGSGINSILTGSIGSFQSAA